MKRLLWQTEAHGQQAELWIEDGDAVLKWPTGEVRGETVEDVLTLAAADPRLSPELYARLMDDVDWLTGGPPRPWTPALQEAVLHQPQQLTLHQGRVLGAGVAVGVAQCLHQGDERVVDGVGRVGGVRQLAV